MNKYKIISGSETKKLKAMLADCVTYYKKQAQDKTFHTQKEFSLGDLDMIITYRKSVSRPGRELTQDLGLLPLLNVKVDVKGCKIIKMMECRDSLSDENKTLVDDELYTFNLPDLLKEIGLPRNRLNDATRMIHSTCSEPYFNLAKAAWTIRKSNKSWLVPKLRSLKSQKRPASAQRASSLAVRRK